MNNFTNMMKIAIKPNLKESAVKWSNPNTHLKSIDTKYYNVGLLTGKINNIIVVDVDVKDNGIEEMKEYIALYGEPQTIRQNTPGGGYHLIFKYNSSNADDQFLIDNYLKTDRSYRNGIDIRSNKGYIVFAPSKIDNKCYKLVQDRNELLEMPRTLIEFILEGRKQSQKQNKNHFNESFTYNINDKQIIEMLKLLDDTYHNNTKKWLIITNILHGLNKFTIWNDWSTMSKKYNYDKNMEIWNNMTSTYDINYLTHLLKIESIARYKNYQMLSSKTSNIQINSKYIQITTDEFNKSDTIIMKSCTGTGKTTATAKAIKIYNSNQRRPKHILSIISKKSLAKQHIKSFADEDIKLVNYLDKTKQLQADNIVCCINSIMLFKDVNEKEFSNYIVYIDEIASFLSDITHNETLRGKLKLCYQILMRIVKNCHKLILSDAKINDNVFNFIRTREIKKPQTIYIENLFKKYLDVPAIKIRDEQLQLDMMIEHVKADDFFLCASDSCKTITKLYMECLKYNSADKFILITAHNQFDISDASEQFANKFVFYSPSIIFGVDFSIDQSQDVFIYNKGRTLDPSAIFQQTTRTRNIRNLYYYSELANADPIYENLENCKQIFTDIKKTSQEINEVCVYLDSDDSEAIVENTFFELFVYNEYVCDLYQTNKTAHYENILKSNGFVLSQIGSIKPLSKAKNQELDEPLLEIKENAFNDLIENGTTEDLTLLTNVQMLKLENVSTETLMLYKDQITDKFKLNEHLDIIRALKDEEFIQQKIFDLERDNYNVTVMTSTYHKIKHIKSFEQRMKIQKYQIDVKLDDVTFFDIPQNEYLLICKLFRIKREKPSNNYKLLNLYVSMVRHVMTSEVIISKKGTTRDNLKISYKLNKDFVKFHIDLNMFSNPYLRNFDEDILTSLGIEKPQIPNNKNLIKNESFIDDDILSNNIKFMDYGLKEEDD